MRNVTELLTPSPRPCLVPEITFQGLHDAVRRTAAGWVARGLRPGQRVLVAVPVSVPLYVTLLSLFWVGATAMLVDPSADLKGILQRHRPDGFVGIPKAHLLRLAVPALRGLRHQVSTGFVPLPHTRLHALEREATVPRHDDPEAPALLTFTTGTTGPPRAMARSHRFLLTQHEVLKHHLALAPDDVDYPTLPVFFLHALAQGASAVLPDADLRHPGSIDADRVLRQMEAHGVTTASGSPAFFARVIDRMLETKTALPRVRRLALGGGRVPGRLLDKAMRALPDAEIQVVYGSTEAEPCCVLEGKNDLRRAIDGEAAGQGALVGRPVPELALRIVDDEVWVSGAHVNQGYVDLPEGEDTQKVRLDGALWHRTGDAGVLRDGELWLLGRMGDRVLGRWPFPVESSLEAKLPWIRRAALVGVGGDAVVACELVDPPADWQAQVERQASARATQVASIPVDPRHNAKVDRSRLVAMLTG